MTRTGKIARLPRAVREQLNLRLADGEPGTQLVAWLNGLAKAEEELARAQVYAESPEGQMEAFEKAYKAVDLQVIKETMDTINRQNLIQVVCDNAKASKRQWLREQMDQQIQERRDAMMAAFKRKRRIATNPTESDQIAPEILAVDAVTPKASRRRRASTTGLAEAVPSGKQRCDDH